MKILLVHTDKFNWASAYRAQALKKQWPDDEVDIVYHEDIPSGDKYDVIHYLYSGNIWRRKNEILKYKDKTFTSLVSYRSLENARLKNKLSDHIEIFKNSKCCVCNNPKLVEEFKKLTQQENAVYIPNGVDEEKFNRKFVVGFVSSKYSLIYKGYELVKQACDELGLELKTTHNGYQGGYYPFDMLPDFYKGVDCLVLASLNEGCSNPVLEALAMNKPVITNRVGIAEELEGVILIDRSVESIKQALRKVSGRIQILEKYTWKKVAAQYHKLYE